MKSIMYAVAINVSIRQYGLPCKKILRFSTYYTILLTHWLIFGTWPPLELRMFVNKEFNNGFVFFSFFFFFLHSFELLVKTLLFVYKCSPTKSGNLQEWVYLYSALLTIMNEWNFYKLY